MAVTWRDRARHLRRLWRMPHALETDLTFLSKQLQALRDELASTRSELGSLKTAAGQIQVGIETLAAEQQQTRTDARAAAFRIMEGTAAATLQLMQPRLEALEGKVDDAAADREKARAEARTENLRLMEGTAAATLQLVQPRLEALEGKVDTAAAEREKARAEARTESFRLMEGTAATTIQLMQPRLEALESKLVEVALTGRPEALQPMVAATVQALVQPLQDDLQRTITSAFAALQPAIADAVEALVQPRHADLRHLIMTATHRGEEAGELARALTAAVAELRWKLDSSDESATRHLLRLEDLGFDVLAFSRAVSGIGANAPRLTLRTEHPVAATSADHLHPRGTANDDTRHPRFVTASERQFGRTPIRHLDLGCAGAGLVWDFLLAGHASYGIEGSDYPSRTRRAYWRVIPDHLFTADVTQPFDVLDGADKPQVFDVITAWEVLEHIPEVAIDGLFGNIARHLAPGGIFVASVATFPDEDKASGAVWHVTIRPREWWLTRAARHGLRPIEGHAFGHADFPRGSGNPRMPDWNASLNPEHGFHIVLGR